MATSDKLFAGSIPELYERYLVPLIFADYAVDLAERIATLAPKDVLEVAAGTGVLTRAMVARLPNDAMIVATDLNQPMLDQASARQPASERVVWRQADALLLPFANQSFDVVACQFGVMFFPDKVRGYSEARRVLRPGGRFFFSVWDEIAANEFADVVTNALGTLFPQDPPRFLARTPHGYADPPAIRETLAAAGFSQISIDTVAGTSKALSPRDVAIAYCHGTPLRAEIEARDGSGLEAATQVAADALQRRFGPGPIEGRIQALVASAVVSQDP